MIAKTRRFTGRGLVLKISQSHIKRGAAALIRRFEVFRNDPRQNRLHRSEAWIIRLSNGK
jgi:hypothetical protein